jgi:hypothetical protein
VEGKAARSVVFPEPRGIRRTNSRSGPAAPFAILALERLQLEPDPLAERPELRGGITRRESGSAAGPAAESASRLRWQFFHRDLHRTASVLGTTRVFSPQRVGISDVPAIRLQSATRGWARVLPAMPLPEAWRRSRVAPPTCACDTSWSPIRSQRKWCACDGNEAPHLSSPSPARARCYRGVDEANR